MLPLVTLMGLAIRFDGIGIYTTLAPPNTCFPDIVEGEEIIPFGCKEAERPAVGTR